MKVTSTLKRDGRETLCPVSPSPNARRNTGTQYEVYEDTEYSYI